MTSYEVLIVGPAGPERSGLKTLLADLGHAVTDASYEECARAADGPWDLVLVLDRRAPAAAAKTLTALDLPPSAPVLLVSGGLTRLIAALSRRIGPRPGGGASVRDRWGAPLSDLSDEELARLTAAGSVPAFEVLHRRYGETLERYCRSILRRPEEAEEAAQTTMLNAYQALRGGRTRGSELRVKPWLFRIAHNQCLDALRRRRDLEELGDQEPSPHQEPAQHLDSRAELGQLVDDLRTLGESQRSALVLRELGGLSHVEIAEALETTPARAKALILQAREALEAFRVGRALTCAEVAHRVGAGDRRVLRSREVAAHLRQCPECAERPARRPSRRHGAAPIAVAAGTPQAA
jgi:RNA polymerase sigma factor (sigma-70 family)